jgi:hypothetical protein
MYYLDIVNQFDVIQSVKIEQDGKTVKVVGMTNGVPFEYAQSYSYTKVAKEVAKRLAYFIGIKK